MNKYIDIPQYTTINEIAQKNFSVSATQYKTFCINNKNCKFLSELLDRDLLRCDLGSDVGSENYVDASNYYFIKAKALQPETMLLNITKESYQPISPFKFVQMNLQAGDILISKDSNVGEIAILDKDYPNAMLCGAIYRLPITKYKYYLLAMIKSDLFRQQIDFLIPRGSTIRHGKTQFLECQIPFPNVSAEHTIKYIELLTKAIIQKEAKIQSLHKQIISSIEYELQNNQKDEKFTFSPPTLNEILLLDRMDSCLFTYEFKKKEFLIKNYIYGTSTVHELGFKISRGQNLQISSIGKSIQTKEKRPNYYKLILPKHISIYGTVKEDEYLGNPNDLKTLKIGDIIFGAEGNEKGRSIAIIEDVDRTITNIHGITLNQQSHDIKKGIFVKLFLDYLRNQGMIDAYAVGGNGGSLAIKYWDFLKFPNFPETIEDKIVELYHNPKYTYDASNCSLKSFRKYDESFNKKAGIYEIQKSLNHLQNKLNSAIQNIANDISVDISF